jgi:hypothetical protein
VPTPLKSIRVKEVRRGGESALLAPVTALFCSIVGKGITLSISYLYGVCMWRGGP